jgi:hypothetical protein
MGLIVMSLAVGTLKSITAYTSSVEALPTTVSIINRQSILQTKIDERVFLVMKLPHVWVFNPKTDTGCRVNVGAAR